MKKITITKEEIKATFLLWEKETREDGSEFKKPESVEECAEEQLSTFMYFLEQVRGDE